MSRGDGRFFYLPELPGRVVVSVRIGIHYNDSGANAQAARQSEGCRCNPPALFRLGPRISTKMLGGVFTCSSGVAAGGILSVFCLNSLKTGYFKKHYMLHEMFLMCSICCDKLPSILELGTGRFHYPGSS
jgi:hypothetical protein